MSEVQVDSGRRRERRTLSAEVSVFDATSNTLLGSLVNIHEEGLMLMSTSPLLLADHIYQLSLRLPDEILGAGEINLGVDCLWVRRSDEGTSMLWGGCHIIDISDEAKFQITELIERMGE